MTLQTSGAITLNDIQTEFGGSNPIGLDEYYAGGSYVPAGTSGTNGAVPSSGTISFWNFYGTSSDTYFLADVPYNTVVKTSFGIDDSNNIYTLFIEYNVNSIIIQKYNSSVGFIWERRIAITGLSSVGATLKVAKSTGNIYILTDYDSNCDYVYLFKYNTSGVLQFAKKYTMTNTHYNVNLTNVPPYLDSSENVYFCLINRTTAYSNNVFIKTNSNGTIQWERTISGGAGQGLSVDGVAKIVGTGTNLYLTAQVDGGRAAKVIKYNTSGSLQWQKTIKASPSTVPSACTMTFNSIYMPYLTSQEDLLISGIYVWTDGTTWGQDMQYSGYFSKLNSSGTITIAKDYRTSNTRTSAFLLSCPNSPAASDVYVGGTYASFTAGTYIPHIIKLDSSGTLTWCKKVENSDRRNQGFVWSDQNSKKTAFMLTDPVASGGTRSFMVKINPSSSTSYVSGVWSYTSSSSPTVLDPSRIYADTNTFYTVYDSSSSIASESVFTGYTENTNTTITQNVYMYLVTTT